MTIPCNFFCWFFPSHTIVLLQVVCFILQFYDKNKEHLSKTNFWNIECSICTAQKLRSSINDFFSECDQETSDLVTFTEEILNGKLSCAMIMNNNLLLIFQSNQS